MKIADSRHIHKILCTQAAVLPATSDGSKYEIMRVLVIFLSQIFSVMYKMCKILFGDY